MKQPAKPHTAKIELKDAYEEKCEEVKRLQMKLDLLESVLSSLIQISIATLDIVDKEKS